MPTIASVPSLKQMRALPLVLGRMSVSATRGRNWVGARRSGRIGGWEEREEWRKASSAGERRVWEDPCGAIVVRGKVLVYFG